MRQNEQSQNICFRKEERAESWETDLLERKKAAHQLERLIANAPGPYVIAMTSEWGSGKTFFLKAWEKDLRDRHRPCVYFNAWETDHAGAPLLALTGCITDSLKKKNLIAPDRLKRLATTASDILAKSPRMLCKMAFGAVNKVVDGALDEAKDEILDAMELSTDLFLRNNDRRANFVEQLETIAAEATEKVQSHPEDPINGTKHFPLFVMIDELDRCRPSYVIELLENIKHLFSARGVVFLLAIDLHQILGIIQHTFGLFSLEERDVRQDYLRKFIDIFWRLPTPDNFKFCYTTMVLKDVPIPSDWPSLSEDTLSRYNEHYYSINEKEYLTNKNSFYGVLAMAASAKNKKLREYIQLIEKYNLISRTYSLNPREGVAIFDALLNRESEISSKVLLREIPNERWPLANPARRLINSEKGLLNEIYKFVIMNIYEFCGQEMKGLGEGCPNDGLLYNIIANIINVSFHGEKLESSVKQKIAFLDEFHFGEKAAS